MRCLILRTVSVPNEGRQIATGVLCAKHVAQLGIDPARKIVGKARLLSEDRVTFSLMRHLLAGGWTILQYHPPGGQAAWGVRLDQQMVYLDILAYRDNVALVLENKRCFDRRDIEKLRRMRNSPEVVRQILDYVRTRCVLADVPLPSSPKILWGHGYSGKQRETCIPSVILLHVAPDFKIAALPPLEFAFP